MHFFQLNSGPAFLAKPLTLLLSVIQILTVNDMRSREGIVWRGLQNATILHHRSYQ